jgi:hypothetical protein
MAKKRKGNEIQATEPKTREFKLLLWNVKELMLPVILCWKTYLKENITQQ